MQVKIEGEELVIRAPLSKGTPSKSGKTLIVATTNGFTPVPDSDIKVSLNAFKYRS